MADTGRTPQVVASLLAALVLVAVTIALVLGQIGPGLDRDELREREEQLEERLEQREERAEERDDRDEEARERRDGDRGGDDSGRG